MVLKDKSESVSLILNIDCVCLLVNGSLIH